MRVLAIDDDSIIRLQLKTLLEKCGDFETDAVARGELGIDMYRIALEDKEPYELILVDINLPDMKGPDVVHALRQLEERAPGAVPAKIMMVTIKNDLKSHAESFFNLCDEYMPKPFTLDELKNKLVTLGILS